MATIDLSFRNIIKSLRQKKMKLTKFGSTAPNLRNNVCALGAVNVLLDLPNRGALYDFNKELYLKASAMEDGFEGWEHADVSSLPKNVYSRYHKLGKKLRTKGVPLFIEK